MSRAWGLSLFILILTGGCRRHDSDASRDGSPSTTTAELTVDEGCPHMQNGECEHAAPSDAPKPHQPGRQAFGKPLGNSPEVALSMILENPGNFHEKRVVVEGHVARACSKKGCWMEIATSDDETAPRCRVTFENYGFLVPRDSAGSHARLEGLVQVTEVKPQAVEHYEAEGAKFPSKSPDGSAREVRLIATGVELERI